VRTIAPADSKNEALVAHLAGLLCQNPQRRRRRLGVDFDERDVGYGLRGIDIESDIIVIPVNPAP
jgi:hypothetical protein